MLEESGHSPVFPSTILDAFDRLLVETIEGRNEHHGRDLVTFLPIAGRKWSNGLMVVGRAMNGWFSGFDVSESVDQDKRREILADTVKCSSIDLVDLAQILKPYNPTTLNGPPSGAWS